MSLPSVDCATAGEPCALPRCDASPLVVEGQRAWMPQPRPSRCRVAEATKPGAEHSQELLAGIPLR